MNKDKGFIFVITVLMITVISLLVLASMQQILLYYKVINRQEASHRYFYNLEDVTRQLIQKKRVFFDPSCIRSEVSPNQAIPKLLHHQGCFFTDEALRYEYFIEDLGDYPCLVTHTKGKVYATHHQRVSILQFNKGEPTSFLQVRWVAVGGVANCLTQERAIPTGVISWRYLPSIEYKYIL